MTSPRHTFEQNPTVFGKILRKELPCKSVYEDDNVIAIHSIQPEAPIHLVIILKQHINHLGEAQPGDATLLGQALSVIPQIAKAAGVLESGFRIVINAGPDSQSEVPHLHFHLLGGKKLGPKIIAE